MSEQETSVGRWWSPAHTAWFSAQIYFLATLSVLLVTQAVLLGTFEGFVEVVPEILMFWLVGSAVTVFFVGFMEEPWPMPTRSISLPVACLITFLITAALGVFVAHKAGVPLVDGLPSAVGVGAGAGSAVVPWRWANRRVRSRRSTNSAKS